MADELIFLAIVGVIFIYAYLHEKDDIFKIIWLFAGLSILMVAFFSNFNISQITSTGQNTNTTITNIIYTRTNSINPVAIGFGGILIAIGAIIGYRILQKVIKASGIF